MKNILIVVLILFSSIMLHAQSYNGGEPFHKNWQQIDTPDFRIIYDDGMDSIAQYYSNLFHFMTENSDVSMGDKRMKLNILLHNETAVENSFVGFAPYRCEQFVSSSPQNMLNLGASEWNFTTPIHEYRHALQFSNAKYGYGKFFRILFGDIGLIGFRSVLVPSWFTEGDATVQETALTNDGRGRVPSFSEEQRAALFNDRNFTYAKWKNGSYIDNLFDYYPMGYQMALYGRNMFGNNAWRNALEDTYRLKRIIYPLSRNFKHLYGFNTKTIHKLALDDLKFRYFKLIDSISVVPNDIIYPTTNLKYPTNYDQPLYNAKGELFALKYSFIEQSKIVEIENGTEREVCLVGAIQGSGYFDECDGKFIWSEAVSSIRRGHVNYIQIVEYDSNTGKRRYLTSGSNTQAPAYSADGKQIVYVETTSNLEKFLVIIDAQTGAIIQRTKSPFLVTFPNFTNNDTEIVFAGLNISKAFIGKYNIRDNEFEHLTIETPYAIGKPVVSGNKIYFTGTFNGINNVYAYHLNSGKVSQVTSALIGLQNPAVNPFDSSLVVSERVFSKGRQFTRVDLSKGDFKQNIEILLTRNQKQDAELYALKAIKAEGGSIYDRIPNRVYETSRYKKGAHLIRPYYWTAYYTDIIAGATVSSMNILSTLGADLSYNYNFQQDVSQVTAVVNYYDLFPILSGAVNQTYNKKTTVSDDLGRIHELLWNETSGVLQVTVPLNLSAHQFVRNINMNAAYGYSSLNYLNGYDFFNESMHSMSLGVSAINRRRIAYAQLQPLYLQSISLLYNQSLVDKSCQFFARGVFKFPGFESTHSTGLSAEYESRFIGDKAYTFADNFSNSRGYMNSNSFTSQYKISANYEHPIWYPDLGIHGLFFFQRLRANYFYDYAVVNSIIDEQNEFSSAGIELKLDGTFFDSLPLQLGATYYYLLNVTDQPGVINITASFGL